MPSLGEQELARRGIAFRSVEYDFRTKGTAATAEATGIDEARLIKTLVIERSEGARIVASPPATEGRDILASPRARSAVRRSDRDRVPSVQRERRSSVSNALGATRFCAVLVSGVHELSLRNLARELGERSVALASERDAERLTGYRLGGLGPFGMRTELEVWVDLGVLAFDVVYVNGGRRGLLLEMQSETLLAATGGRLIDVGRDG